MKIVYKRKIKTMLSELLSTGYVLMKKKPLTFMHNAVDLSYW